MMEEMPFEDIKVKELCDRAMIRKSTFYKHFADKYELLAFIVKEAINDYNERIRRDSPTDDLVAFYNKMLDYVFEFAKANQKLIRSAIRSGSLVLCIRWKTYGNKKNDTEPIRADTKSEQHTV